MKAYEPERGCGYRQVGKLYLVGVGVEYVCPSLPLDLGACDCCGYKPPIYRDFQWIAKVYIKHIRKPTGQACNPGCPICYGVNDQDRYGLMWVGKKFYSPREFLAESVDMDVSKAIKQIPTGLVLGESWVLLAHRQARVDSQDPEYKKAHEYWLTRGVDKIPPDPEPQPPTYPGIFYGFIPQRVEILIYQSEATPERVRELEDRGITVIIVPDEFDAHAKRTRKTRGRRNK